MKKLNHRNIVRLHEVIDDPASDKLYSVMQYVDRGPVLKDVRFEGGEATCETIPVEKVVKFTRQIIAALVYLHNHGIAHCDVKPENVLLSSQDCVYLADFGVSELMEAGSNDVSCTGLGTPAFMAPEMFDPSRTKVNGIAVDIWGLGVTAFLMRYGFLPFKGANISEAYESARTASIVFPDSSTEEERDFFNKCLAKNPEERTSMKELRNHPFLAPRLDIEDFAGSIMYPDRDFITEEDVQRAFSKVVSITRQGDEDVMTTVSGSSRSCSNESVRSRSVVNDAAPAPPEEPFHWKQHAPRGTAVTHELPELHPTESLANSTKDVMCNSTKECLSSSYHSLDADRTRRATQPKAPSPSVSPPRE
jgi:[calcium/calmodulin-dependent protein kinase] kinase